MEFLNCKRWNVSLRSCFLRLGRKRLFLEARLRIFPIWCQIQLWFQITGCALMANRQKRVGSLIN